MLYFTTFLFKLLLTINEQLLCYTYKLHLIGPGQYKKCNIIIHFVNIYFGSMYNLIVN